jgi:hypothetical protein
MLSISTCTASFNISSRPRIKLNTHPHVFPLSQTDNLLFGLIEEHRDGVAVRNHGANERQRRALRF